MDDTERSASDIAGISRASTAGEEDGEAGSYNPKPAASDDQKEAYEDSYSKGRDKAD